MGTRPSSTEMMSTGDRSVYVTEQLKDSVRVMYENMDISDNVNSELKDQSSRLTDSKEKVVGIRHDLVKGERKIKSMMVRARKNKCIVRGVLAFLFILAAVLIVSLFK